MFFKKFVIWLVLLIPLSVLLVLAVLNLLGPDPGKEMMLYLGHISFTLILLVVALPLLKRLPYLTWLSRCSRLLGLFACFYVSLHLLSYAAFFIGFRLDLLFEDLLERPYVYIGFSAWCILVVMALTSNRWSQRLLKRRWKYLHRLIYLVICLGLVHVFWIARSDLKWVYIYSGLFLALIIGKYLIIWSNNALFQLNQKNLK